MSLDAVAVLPLSISEFDCFSLGATPVSYDAVASECAWLAWYCLSEESALYLFGRFRAASGVPWGAIWLALGMLGFIPPGGMTFLTSFHLVE